MPIESTALHGDAKRLQGCERLGDDPLQLRQANTLRSLAEAQAGSPVLHLTYCLVRWRHCCPAITNRIVAHMGKTVKIIPRTPTGHSHQYRAALWTLKSLSYRTVAMFVAGCLVAPLAQGSPRRDLRTERVRFQSGRHTGPDRHLTLDTGATSQFRPVISRLRFHSAN